MHGEEVIFLSVDEVLLIHERTTEAFGGSSGVRDQGLLESALFRPRTGYYRDLIEMAAALFESLLMNHPFVDGNKRAAFFTADVFLRVNGWKIMVDGKEGDEQIRGMLEEGEANLERIDSWLRDVVVPLG